MNIFKRIGAVVLSLAQMAVIFLGYHPPKEHIQTTGPVNVFIGGLLGFGENVGVSRVVSYWGALAGDICGDLEALGYESYQANVGPVSSAWDRACEMYAELTGARVDYGEAHSREHNHDRFGRTFTEPLFDGWSAKRPVNLIGHSFGGNTARVFAMLCDEGSAAEREATPEAQRSPLFNGGIIDRVHAIVTMATPHNGTTASVCLPDEFEESDYLWIYKIINFWGDNRLLNGVYDLQLDHFRLSDPPGVANGNEPADALARNFLYSKDHSFSDLSLDGANRLNAADKIRPSVYYFSYSAKITTPWRNGDQLPVLRELADPVLFVFSIQMGVGAGVEPPGEAWKENDGAVPLPSALFPAGQPHRGAAPADANLRPGIWNVMPTVENADHAYLAGGDVLRHDYDEILQIYVDLMAMLERTY